MDNYGQWDNLKIVIKGEWDIYIRAPHSPVGDGCGGTITYETEQSSRQYLFPTQSWHESAYTHDVIN